MKIERKNLNQETKSRNVLFQGTRLFLSCLMLLASCFVFLLNSSCGALYGPGNNSTGDFDLSSSADSVDFDSSDGTAVHNSIALENETSDTITITNIIFANNICADFSLYNITDSTGVIVFSGNGEISLEVAAGETVNVNVRYSPSVSCAYSDYETTLYVYYTDGESTFRTSIILRPSAEFPSGLTFACNDITDQSENFTVEEVTGVPSDGTYYLRVDRMRGFMYVPASGGVLTDDALTLGTDVNGLSAEDFVTPFLETVISAETGTLSEITEDEDFCLPAPEENPFFGGAFTLMTSSEDFTGTVDSDGNISLEGITMTILSEGIPDGLTFEISSDGTFQISLNADLTTGQAPIGGFVSESINTGLEEASEQTDDDGDPLLPIEKDGDGNYYMEGSPADDGQMILVGVGTFTNEDDTFIGAGLARSFLLDDEAYLFFMLEATITTKNATEE